jgi:hypothetical protein
MTAKPFHTVALAGASDTYEPAYSIHQMVVNRFCGHGAGLAVKPMARILSGF